MDIYVEKRSRDIGTISNNDTLIFQGRKEKVSKIDVDAGKVHTERMIQTGNFLYPWRKEFVLYTLAPNKGVHLKSSGNVYSWLTFMEKAR